MAMSRARRDYNRTTIVCMMLYVGALFAGERYFSVHPGSHGALAYLIAAVPGLMIALVFVAIGRFLVAERDEYLRMLMVRQSLIATGIALCVATIWGFLESFGLAPHVPAYWVSILWFGGLGVGQCVNKVVERRAS